MCFKFDDKNSSNVAYANYSNNRKIVTRTPPILFIIINLELNVLEFVVDLENDLNMMVEV